MEKNKKKLILFMPSMDGGGVEKNLVLISNYLSNYIKNVTLITFDDRFNFFFNEIDQLKFTQKLTFISLA